MDSDNSRKTLSGTRTLTADILNLPNSVNALRIKGNSGTAGQILKKNDDTNKLEWNEEQTITATLPITITNNVVDFDHGNPQTTRIRRSIYHTGGLDTQIFSVGTTIKLQEHSGVIFCENLDAPNVNVDSILKVRDPSNHYITEVSLDKDKLDVGAGNTNFYMGTADKPINEIVSNNQNVKTELIVGTITSGNTIDIDSNGLNGYSNHAIGCHINNFNSIALHSNSPNADYVGIDTNGRGIYTRGGNINLHHSGDYGKIENVGGIDGKSGDYHLASGTDIRFIGESNIRRSITDEIQIKSFTNSGPTGDINIEIHGTNNTITGNNSTAISGIHSINTSGLTATGTITSSGNITMTGTGVTGILTCANTPIFSSGLKQAVGGGNFSITANGTFAMNDGTFSGNVDMSGNNMSNIQNITYNDAASTFSGGSASNKVVFTHCDLSSSTNTEASQFTGNKLFLNDVEIQGNTTLGNNDTDITTQKGVLADNREFQSTNNYSSLFNYEKTFYDLNNSLPYVYKTNILNQTHHAPFASTRLSQSQNANYPYRAIKIHPTDFLKNDDHSYYDISVYDNLGTGNAPTTGTSGIGGVKIASTSLELWHYLDIPEGLSLEAIFLRISNTSGSSFVGSERLKVWKKNIGLDCQDMTKMIEIIDQDVSTSTASLYAPEPNYVGGGTATIYEQDLINDYDSSMVLRLHLDSTSNIFMGGYALCRPTLDIRYKVSVTTSGFVDNFTMTYMGQDGNVSETFTSGYQTKIFYIPYRHGGGPGGNHFRFFLSYTGNRYYDLDNCVNCLIGDGTQATEKNWNATGTRDINCIRQEMTYVINQKNSTSAGSFNQHILHIGTFGGQSTIKVTINGTQKTYNTGDSSKTFSAMDFGVINLHEDYAITMLNSMDASFQGAGITFDFTAHYGCSVSGATWDGNNSSPITINFAQADSSLVFNLTT